MVERFTKPQKPNTIRLEEVYKFGARADKMSNDAKKQVKDLLKQAKYSDGQIHEIVDKNEPIKVSDMRNLMSVLHQNEMKGFDSFSPNIMLREFQKKERVRKSSIGQIKQQHLRERMAESRAEQQAKTQSLNSLSKPKTGGSQVNLPF